MHNIAIQRSVIFTIVGLHNFIRQHNIKDFDFDSIDTENDVVQAQHVENNE